MSFNPAPKPSQKPPKARKPLKRSRVKPVNRERQARVKDRPYRDWIKAQGCLLNYKCECVGPVDPAHIETFAASGQERGMIVPLCRYHHSQQEGRNAAFERRHLLNLALEGARYLLAYIEEGHR